MYDNKQLIGREEPIHIVMEMIQRKDREVLVITFLNNRLEAIATEFVAMGSIICCMAKAREIFKY